MKETNSVLDILLFDEKHNLIERIGPFVEDYSDVVELGYSRLSEKKSGQPKPAYFTIEKKFLPFLNQPNENPLNDEMVVDIPVRIFKCKDESEEHYYVFPQLEPTNKSVIKGYLWFDSNLDRDLYDVEPVLSTSNSYIPNPYLVIKANVPNPVMKIYLEPCYASHDSVEKDITWIGVDENGRLVESKPKILINNPDIIELDRFPQK